MPLVAGALGSAQSGYAARVVIALPGILVTEPREDNIPRLLLAGREARFRSTRYHSISTLLTATPTSLATGVRISESAVGVSMLTMSATTTRS